MPALAKALFRNRLTRLTQGLQELADRKQREREMNDFLTTMDEIRNRNRDRYYKEEFYNKQPEPFEQDLAPGQDTKQILMGGMRGGVYPKMREAPSTTPVGPMNEVPITDPRELRKAGVEGQRDIMELFRKGLGYEQVPFEKVGAGANMLQQLLQLRQPPKPDLRTLGKGEGLYDISNIGTGGEPKEIIARQTEGKNYVGPELDENGKEVTYKIGDQEYYNEQTITPEGKVIKNIRKPITKRGSTNININQPIVPNYGNSVRELTTLQGDYEDYNDEISKLMPKYNKLKQEVTALKSKLENEELEEDEKANIRNDIAEKEGKIGEIDSEIKYAADKKKILFNRIKATTDDIAVQFAAKKGYENFDVLFQSFLGSKKIVGNKNPQSIDKIIGEVMKGVDPSAISLMKRIVKARIFNEAGILEK